MRWKLKQLLGVLNLGEMQKICLFKWKFEEELNCMYFEQLWSKLYVGFILIDSGQLLKDPWYFTQMVQCLLSLWHAFPASI